MILYLDNQNHHYLIKCCQKELSRILKFFPFSNVRFQVSFSLSFGDDVLDIYHCCLFNHETVALYRQGFK